MSNDHDIFLLQRRVQRLEREVAELHAATPAPKPDLLDEITAERTRVNPAFPELVAKAEARRPLAPKPDPCPKCASRTEEMTELEQAGWLEPEAVAAVKKALGYARDAATGNAAKWINEALELLDGVKP